MPPLTTPDRFAARDPSRARLPPIDPAEHLSWARGIARGVRHRYGFLRGSQEERDLEATAALVVCEYAPKFVPALSWRVGTARAVARQLRALKPRRIITPQWADVWFDGSDYGAWAIGMGHREANRRTLTPRSPTRRMLVRLALQIAHRRAREFDAPGAFRGWAAVEVRGRCQREAVRLRNAGTFHTAADLDWGWQAVGMPGAADGDDEDGREADVPRQLRCEDDEYDDDSEWYELWLKWCLRMVRGRRRRRPLG